MHASPVTFTEPAPPAGLDPTTTRLVEALDGLRPPVRQVRFPLDIPSAERARETARTVLRQLDDYLIPRLSRLDAPLLAVVGGSTGAGKSTLVNSIVRAPVTTAGILRPTTRAPVLVCHPNDAGWFGSSQLLPGLRRSSDTRTEQAAGTLRVVSAPALDSGLALLDAPDIDSVVDANHELAHQLLDAADLWLFVTTAARYADAVPWEVLKRAQERGTVVAMVLDRVPAGAEHDIASHLVEMLTEHGLAVPLFVIPEADPDGQGLLPEQMVEALRTWLGALARDATARAAVVRQTLGGAITALQHSVTGLASAATDQLATARTLSDAVDIAYAAALNSTEDGIRDGSLLRGEVLARWQEFVGTGELMRTLHTRVGRIRDQVVAALTGRPDPPRPLQNALTSGLVALVQGEATEAGDRAYAAWRAHPAGAGVLAGALAGRGSTQAFQPTDPDLGDRVEAMARDWQRAVLELVRTQAGDRKRIAQISAYAVNATGLLVMIGVFASTAFIPTGLEVAVAGGTTMAAQKVLEAVFGDQAIRDLAGRARTDLVERVNALYAEEKARVTGLITTLGLDPEAPDRLEAAAADLAGARTGAGLSDFDTLPAAPPTTHLPAGPPLPAAVRVAIGTGAADGGARPGDPDGTRSIFALPPGLTEADLTTARDGDRDRDRTVITRTDPNRDRDADRDPTPGRDRGTGRDPTPGRDRGTGGSEAGR